MPMYKIDNMSHVKYWCLYTVIIHEKISHYKYYKQFELFNLKSDSQSKLYQRSSIVYHSRFNIKLNPHQFFWFVFGYEPIFIHTNLRFELCQFILKRSTIALVILWLQPCMHKDINGHHCVKNTKNSK